MSGRTGLSEGRSIGGEIKLRPRRVLYGRNGFRSVPIERTLAEIDGFLLSSGREIQFDLFRRDARENPCACIVHLSPDGEDHDERYYGKGAGLEQAFASACVELFERLQGRRRPGDRVLEASFANLGREARDPRGFGLAPESGYDPSRSIDWVRGFSLTEGKGAWVPANLVFLHYRADSPEKRIARADSNGLAAGNNLEEAVLHGILELVERDVVMISEYNELPISRLSPRGLPDGILALLERAGAEGYACALGLVPTDLPVPVVSAFLRNERDPADCSIAYGCHLDPSLAVERALTEAVQVLPPSAYHEEWYRSCSLGRYTCEAADERALADVANLASNDLKRNVEICVERLAEAGAEVIVVDLSVDGWPFPAVRVLAPGLQPIMRGGDRRLSRRLFEVPVKLGLRGAPLDPGEVRFRPICGYR
jgi:thioglycine synthase